MLEIGIMSKRVLCDYCVKTYANKASLLNHQRNKHADIYLLYKEKNVNNDEVNDNITNDNEVNNNIDTNKAKYKCEYCSRTYKYSQNRSKHYKKCKKKKILETEDEDEKLLSMIVEMTKKIESQERELQLQSKEIRVQTKEIKLLKARNKQLKESGGNINNTINNGSINSNNKTNNINNGTINNIKIVALGNENITEVFSEEEQLNILKQGHDCFNYLVKQVHFNPNYPQFQNIRLKNMRSNVGYVYDSQEDKFIAITKKNLIDKVKFERADDMEVIYNCNNTNEQLNSRDKVIVNKYIDILGNDDRSKILDNDLECLIYNGSTDLS